MPMRFAIFPARVSKVLRLPRKSDARSYEVLHPVTQNYLPKTEGLKFDFYTHFLQISNPRLNKRHIIIQQQKK